MKKIIMIAGCFLLFFVSASGENIKLVKSESHSTSKAVKRPPNASFLKDAVPVSNSEVQVFNARVSPPGNSENIICSFRVRNNTSQPAAAGKYKFFVTKRKQGGGWEPAISGFLPAIGANQVISHTVQVKLSLIIREVQIAIHEDNDSSKPVITLTTRVTKMPPVSTVKIESVHTDINSWSVVIRNTSQYNLWNVTVQTTMSSGGNWNPAGGVLIKNLSPGASHPCIMPKPAGWKNGYDNFKVSLYQSPDLIFEKIYPFSDTE